MGEQKGFTPILIIIFIALAVGGYLLYQKQTKPISVPQPSHNSAVTPVASSSAAASPVPNGIEETANWKTYSREIYGQKISFKYPSSWLISEGGYSKSEPVYSLSLDMGGASEKPAVNQLIISVMMMSSRGGGAQSIEQEKNGLIKSGYSRDDITDLKIGGQPAIKVLKTNLDSPSESLKGLRFWFYEVFNNGIYYFFKSNSAWSDAGIANIDQILSTFKFTN